MITLNDLTLLHDRVVIQLDEVGDTITEGGVIVPLYENYETDGGKPGSKVSSKKYTNTGTVLALSESASKQIPALQAGNKVFVSNSSVSTPQYHFYIDRTKLVQDFTGVISIPAILVEAIINN